MMRFSRVGFYFALILISLAACNSQPTPAPIPDAATLLDKAGTEIRSAQSFKIKLQVTGAPAYIDAVISVGGTTNAIAFVSADGNYAAPDKVSARLVANVMGMPGKVDIVAIGNDQYINSPLITAGKWTNQMFSPDFNASNLIASDKGIAAVLKSLKGLTVTGPESVDGTPMYHLTGQATGADVSAMTMGLITGNQVTLDIFIAVDTGRIDHAVIVQPETATKKDQQPTTWTLEIYDYNTTITITPPPSVAVPAATASATDDPNSMATEAATETSTQAQ